MSDGPNKVCEWCFVALFAFTTALVIVGFSLLIVKHLL